MRSDRALELFAVAIAVVAITAATLALFGPRVEHVYTHCSETPAPGSGITCRDYMPVLEP